MVCHRSWARSVFADDVLMGKWIILWVLNLSKEKKKEKKKKKKKHLKNHIISFPRQTNKTRVHSIELFDLLIGLKGSV